MYRDRPIDEAVRTFGVRASGTALAARLLAGIGLAVLGVGTIRLGRAALHHQPLSWPLIIVGASIVLGSLGIEHAARRRLIISRTGTAGGLAIEGTAISLVMPLAISGAQVERRVRIANLGGFVAAHWTATLQLVDARGRGVVLCERRHENLGAIDRWSDGLPPSEPTDLPCFDVEYEQLAQVRAALG